MALGASTGEYCLLYASNTSAVGWLTCYLSPPCNTSRTGKMTLVAFVFSCCFTHFRIEIEVWLLQLGCLKDPSISVRLV
jgi:hypothetical protein